MARKRKRKKRKDKKLDERPNHIIRAYVDKAPVVFDRYFRKDRCINATRVLIDVMDHFKIKARPLSVFCAVHNKILVDYMKKYGHNMSEEQLDEAYDNGAWGVRIETEGTIKAGGWPGHLVAIVQDRWLVDSAAGQMSRPHKGINLPPIMVAPATRRFQKGSEGCTMHNSEGAVLFYNARPDDESYAAGAGWQRHPVNRKVVAEIIEAMSQRKVIDEVTSNEY